MKKKFIKGARVVMMNYDSKPEYGFKPYEQFTIKEVHSKSCGCGGDKLEFEQRPGAKYCTKGFTPAIDILQISKNLKLTSKDFEL